MRYWPQVPENPHKDLPKRVSIIPFRRQLAGLSCVVVHPLPGACRFTGKMNILVLANHNQYGPICQGNIAVMLKLD